MAKIPYKAIVKRFVSHFPGNDPFHYNWYIMRRPTGVRATDDIAVTQYWAPDGIYVDEDDGLFGRVVVHVAKQDNDVYEDYTDGSLTIGRKLCRGIRWDRAYKHKSAKPHAVLFMPKIAVERCGLYMNAIDGLVKALRSLTEIPNEPVQTTPSSMNWHLTEYPHQNQILFETVGNVTSWQPELFATVHGKYKLLSDLFRNLPQVAGSGYDNTLGIGYDDAEYTHIGRWWLNLFKHDVTDPEFQVELDTYYTAIANVIHQLAQIEFSKLDHQALDLNDPGQLL